jgi:hypothetical protein
MADIGLQSRKVRAILSKVESLQAQFKTKYPTCSSPKPSAVCPSSLVPDQLRRKSEIEFPMNQRYTLETTDQSSPIYSGS